MKVEFSPNSKEIEVINEVMDYIEEKFGKETIKLEEFEVFEPLTSSGKATSKIMLWGSNGLRIHYNEESNSFRWANLANKM